MTIDWVSIGIAVASALVTAIVHRSATLPSSPATNGLAPASASPGGLFHGGLLHRLQAAAPVQPGQPGSTGHPILDSIVSTLQGIVAQNPQLLTSLNGVLIQLQHPGGSVNLNLSNSGGTNNASQTSSNPVVPVPAAAVAAGS
jgi:hypothetical protein